MRAALVGKREGGGKDERVASEALHERRIGSHVAACVGDGCAGEGEEEEGNEGKGRVFHRAKFVVVSSVEVVEDVICCGSEIQEGEGERDQRTTLAASSTKAGRGHSREEVLALDASSFY